MFIRVTRSKSGVKAASSLASHPASSKRGSRSFTSSFKVSKDAMVKKAAVPKITTTAVLAAAAGRARTFTTTSTSKVFVATGNTATTTAILSSVGNLSPASSTEAISPQELLAKGLLHLRTVSPSLERWIDNKSYSRILTYHLRKPDDPPLNYFQSLVQGIISQQFFGPAAATVLKKFIAGFYTPTAAAPNPPPGFFPTPTQVLNRSTVELRAVGLPERKVQYMKSVATEFLNDPSLSQLHNLSNEAIAEKLTKIKGIGEWSVQMLLIFTLGRWDVFSTGDLGIQKGMAVWDGRDVNELQKQVTTDMDGVKKVAPARWKYMSEDDMRRLSEPFSPWRSLFCMVMWKASAEATKGVRKPRKRKAKKVEVGVKAEKPKI